MNRMGAMLLGVVLALAGGAFAATSGGFPSRPRLQMVTVGNSTAGGVITLEKSGTTRGDVGIGANCGGSFNVDAICIDARTGYHIEMAANGRSSPDWRINASGMVETLVNASFAGEITVDPGGGTDELLVQSGAIAVNGTFTANGAAVATETSGTFTASFVTACTTTPTLVFDWIKTGNVVTLQIVGGTGFPCTGDATSFITAAGDAPAAIRPINASNAIYIPQAVDNGTNFAAILNIQTDGAVILYKQSAFGAAPSSTGWTAAGTRSVPNATGSTSYILTNP